MPKANESLQLGIYYLAAQEAEDLKEVGAITGVELAYLKGTTRPATSRCESGRSAPASAKPSTRSGCGNDCLG